MSAVAQTPEVARSLVLIGRSFAGYLAPRAASFEHRLAALVCDPAQPDLGALTGATPGPVDMATALDVVASGEPPDPRPGAGEDALTDHAGLAHPAASTSDTAVPRPATSRFPMTPPAAR
jgi:hypothetical protein